MIRSVGQRHYRAAKFITEFPETFYAIRDAVDARIAADAAAEEEAGSIEAAETVEGAPD